MGNSSSCPLAPFNLGSSGRLTDNFWGCWPHPGSSQSLHSILAEFGRERCCAHQIKSQPGKGFSFIHTPTLLPSLWGKGIQVHVGLSSRQHWDVLGAGTTFRTGSEITASMIFFSVVPAFLVHNPELSDRTQKQNLLCFPYCFMPICTVRKKKIKPIFLPGCILLQIKERINAKPE